MRTEFNNLKTELLDNNVDASNWSVISNLLNKLDDKITEVEKRLICIDKTAKEIKKAIGKYTESVDSNEAFKMSVDNHDVILRGSHDLMIAVDLGDDEPIKSDWYGLFTKVDKEIAFDFESSWGRIECNKDGIVINVIGDEYFDGKRNYLYDIERIDIAEYSQFCISLNITHGECYDILAVGFWKRDGTYNEADKDWRKEIYGIKDVIPTELCKTPQTHEFVKDIIAKLKVINVDGETMEYILEQVGMTDQMLRQLIMNNPETDTKDLLQEKMELNNKSVSSYI